MAYLDSNVFVYAVTHDPEKNTKAKQAVGILKQLEGREIKGITSFLTWDELCWVVRKLHRREAGIKAGARFLKLQNLSLHQVNLSVILRARELEERYALKPRDAIHVATALTAGEKEMISDDADCDVVSEVKRRALG